MPAVAFCMRPSLPHRPPSTAIARHREPSRAAQSHWRRRDRGSGLAGHVRSNAADGRPTHGLPPTHASPSAAEGRSRIGAILVFWGFLARDPILRRTVETTPHAVPQSLRFLPLTDWRTRAPSARLFLVSLRFLLHRTATSRAWMRPGFAKANSTRGSAHNRRCVSGVILYTLHNTGHLPPSHIHKLWLCLKPSPELRPPPSPASSRPTRTSVTTVFGTRPRYRRLVSRQSQQRRSVLEAVPQSLAFSGLPQFEFYSTDQCWVPMPMAAPMTCCANGASACAQCLQRRQPRVDTTGVQGSLVCWLLVGPIRSLQAGRSWQFSPKPPPARQSRPRLLPGGGFMGAALVGPGSFPSVPSPQQSRVQRKPFSRWSPISSALGEGPQLPWLGLLHPSSLRFLISLPHDRRRNPTLDVYPTPPETAHGGRASPCFRFPIAA